MNPFHSSLQEISSYEHSADDTHTPIDYDGDTRSITTNPIYVQGINSNMDNASFPHTYQQQMRQQENNMHTPAPQQQSVIKIYKHNAFDIV